MDPAVVTGVVLIIGQIITFLTMVYKDWSAKQLALRERAEELEDRKMLAAELAAQEQERVRRDEQLASKVETVAGELASKQQTDNRAIVEKLDANTRITRQAKRASKIAEMVANDVNRKLVDNTARIAALTEQFGVVVEKTNDVRAIDAETLDRVDETTQETLQATQETLQVVKDEAQAAKDEANGVSR